MTESDLAIPADVPTQNHILVLSDVALAAFPSFAAKALAFREVRSRQEMSVARVLPASILDGFSHRNAGTHTPLRKEVSQRRRPGYQDSAVSLKDRLFVTLDLPVKDRLAVSSDLAVETSLIVRAVFHQPLRQTEGLVGSLLELMGLDLPVPDHSTLSRRARTLAVAPQVRTASGPVHLLVDSTEVKLSGPGEWLVEKHGTQRRRAWRKLHLAVDAKTGTIVASTLTSKEVDDGAYDQDRVYDDVAEHSAEAAVIVPPRATVVLSPSAETDPTQRDRHIQVIAEHGRMSWQRTSGYNAKAGAEGTMSRYKRCYVKRRVRQASPS
jgi:hypothetical protein